MVPFIASSAPGSAIFQVALVGKDGRSTLQWSKPVSSEMLFSVIEKRRQQRKGGAPL
jgi:hypothetical protein